MPKGSHSFRDLIGGKYWCFLLVPMIFSESRGGLVNYLDKKQQKCHQTKSFTRKLSLLLKRLVSKVFNQQHITFKTQGSCLRNYHRQPVIYQIYQSLISTSGI